MAHRKAAQIALVEHGQPLGEEFTVEHACAEARHRAESDPLGQFTQSGAHAAHIVRIQVL